MIRPVDTIELSLLVVVQLSDKQAQNDSNCYSMRKTLSLGARDFSSPCSHRSTLARPK